MAATPPLRLALPLLGALAGCHDESDPWRDLVADHVTTTGRISHVDCDGRASVRYAFSASGQWYRAEAPEGVFDCRAARVGDPVLVYYAPQEPAVSTLLPPAQAYDHARGRTLAGGAWLALVGTASVAASLLAALRRARQHAA